MKKQSAFRSAFFNPPVLISFAACAIVALVALIAFALYPGGNARAQGPQQAQSSMPEFAPENVNVAQGVVVEIRKIGALEMLGLDAPLGQWVPAQFAPQAPPSSQADAAVGTVPLNVTPLDPTQATPTPTPAGIAFLDTFTAATAFNFTGSTPRTYMGDGFTGALGAGTTYVSIRSYTFYMGSVAAAVYTDLHARMKFWSTYVQTATAVNQFSNAAALFDVDLGAFSPAASSFYAVTVTVLPPFPFFAGGPGSQWGYVANYQSSTGGPLADDSNLTSVISSCAACAGTYAVGQITTGTAPNYGYYRNASSEVDFNFLGTSSRTLGLVSQGIAIIIRGDQGTGATPTPSGPTPTPCVGCTPTPTPAPTASPTPSPTPPPTVCVLPTEDFADVNTLIPAGWKEQNNSQPLGSTGWFQGQTSAFNSQSGAPTAYIAANYQNGSGLAVQSNWLLTPPITLQNGAQLSFWTRTIAGSPYPDRLQVRMSTAGNGYDVGTLATDVGTFTTLLLDLNPTYTVGGYPEDWTHYVVTISGLGLPIKGRLAFHYFVEGGGDAGANGNFIGIDTVGYDCAGGAATPTPTASPTPTPTPSPTSTPGPNGCTWGFGTVVPIPILDEAVTSVGGNLYSFGGVSTTTIANAYKFDGTTWTAIAPLPAVKEYPSAVNNGTDCYILGGVTGGLATTTLYRYNVGANTYTTLAPFTTATWNQAAVYLPTGVAGRIYKFAGTNDTPASVAALEIYDISSGLWTTGAPYPVATSFPMAFAQGGFIYAGGGIDAVSGLETAKTYRYDPGTDTWDDLAIADLPTTRWAGASSFGNCCTGGGVFAGGYIAGDISFTAISWDSGSNTWLSMPNMLGERTRMNGAVLNGTFYVVGGRSDASPSFVGTNTNQKLSCPATPTPTPTPAVVSISGTAIYCGSGAPVPGVTMTRTGTTSGSTTTDSLGNYTFTGLPSGGSYVVTPSKANRLRATTSSINGSDVLAVKRHFLGIALIPVGCRRVAADVDGVFPPGGNGLINGVDVSAIQKFFLSNTSYANVGRHKFTPASITYTAIVTNQTAQNYDVLVFGDVNTAWIYPSGRPGGVASDGLSVSTLSELNTSADEVPSTVAAVALPEVAVAQSRSNFAGAVGSSAIDAKSNLIGFQGDFTFDERVVTFQSEPVSKAGLTGGDWEVAGNVLPGPGPIRTLRILGFSNDGVTALSGSGTLFELNMIKVSKAPGASTQLIWAAPPDHFIFIDADLTTQKPGYAASGGVTSSGKRK